MSSPVTSMTINQFFEAKVKKECPACGAHDSWVLLTNGDTEYATAGFLVRVPSYEDATVINEGGGMPLVHLRCAECGHVLSFDLRYVYRKIREER